jgi:hypothetical protein
MPARIHTRQDGKELLCDRSGIGLSGYRLILITVCTENFTWCGTAGVYRGDSRLTSKNWWDNRQNYTALESSPSQSARCTLTAVLRHQLLIFLTTFMLNVSFEGQWSSGYQHPFVPLARLVPSPILGFFLWEASVSICQNLFFDSVILLLFLFFSHPRFRWETELFLRLRLVTSCSTRFLLLTVF